jgi:AcrR family transcriptional regulator
VTDERKRLTPRKRPVQARSKQTVECILEAAARIFRAEGFEGTTNRIAMLAGVSVGTLYEYFPNKQALLAELAEGHVTLAEAGINAALSAQSATPEFLRALQAAVLASHRYPSQALDFVADQRAAAHLRSRVSALRQQILAGLESRARADRLSEPALRARTVFGLIAELSSRTLYEFDAETHAKLAAQLLDLAIGHLEKF